MPPTERNPHFVNVSQRRFFSHIDCTTISGCLNKGDGANSYVLTDEKTGMKTQVTGSAELEKHSANHKVTVTSTRGSGNTFKVTKIQYISASCQVSATP